MWIRPRSSDLLYKPNDAAVPQVPVMMSPITPTAIYVIPTRCERMSEVTIELSAPLVAVWSISEAIQGDLGKLLATGEHPALHNYCNLIPPLPSCPVSPAHHDHMSKIALASPTASYPARINWTKSDEAISICSAPHTQHADHDPYELSVP